MDGLGSVRQLTNPMGQVTDTYTYDAFGSPLVVTGSTVNPYRFAGEQADPNVGYYLRARYYNPSAGRMVGRDPIMGSLTQPMSRHSYLYGFNNPVNLTDPSGLLD
jgi:RHS repeat-associated protein